MRKADLRQLYLVALRWHPGTPWRAWRDPGRKVRLVPARDSARPHLVNLARLWWMLARARIAGDLDQVHALWQAATVQRQGVSHAG